MERDIVFFDLETTGVDIAKDRIVQIATLKRFADGKPEEVKNLLINPEMPIPKEASDIHGVTDEMVKDCPPFKQYAMAIWEYMEGCDLGGYNHIKFDVPLLVEEFLRAGLTPDFSNVTMIDGFVAYRKMTPRDLTSCYETLTGKEMKGAHDAEADIKATVEVIDFIQENASDSEELFEIESEVVDYAGKFGKNEGGEIIYMFGKDKGKVVNKFDSFLGWMLKNDFTMDTKNWVRKLQK